MQMNNKNWEESIESLLNTDENLEEREKLSFLCSCIIDSLKAGGSVLILFNRLGTLLQLLEEISASLESSTLKVPIYVISSVAEELLAYTNVIPEWLCKEQQEKLFSGESLFAHVELIKENKLHVFPAVHSPKLLTNWQPKIVLLPDDLRQQIRFPNANSFSVVHYSENASINIPSLKDSSELEIATDLAFQFQWRKLKHENMNATRLKGELSVYHCKHRLHSGNEQEKSSKSWPLLHWGSPDVGKLLNILSKMGINGSVEQGADNGKSEQTCIVHIHVPKKALIE